MRERLVVVVGETASGKSALALELAKKFDGEIIAADSWTVYRGFDVGTAKPSLQERQHIPHHLIDVADPLQGFSAAEFKRLASLAIDDINSRRRLPILVGGTGLYIDSILFDYSFLPAGSPEDRQMLDKLSVEDLLVRIEQAKISTTGIDIRNKRRLIRLLESNGLRPVQKDIRKDTLIIGLRVSAEELIDRITSRVDSMLASGLESEVRDLSNKYGWDTEPMKGIGYREFKDYFAGKQNLDQTRQRIIRSSMQLAKKQRTWFKRNKYIQWVNDPCDVVALVTTFLNK